MTIIEVVITPSLVIGLFDFHYQGAACESRLVDIADYFAPLVLPDDILFFSSHFSETKLD
jgi:hypothetical protein